MATKKNLLAVFITAVFCAVAITLPSVIENVPKPPPEPPKPLTAEQKVALHLQSADVQCSKAIEASLKDVRTLFTNGHAGAKAYAEEVLGWNGKWELFRSGIFKLQKELRGWDTDTQSHERYLMTEFRCKVLDPDDLKQAINKALEAYLSEVEAIENEMLVRLRVDVFNEARAGTVPLDELNEEFKRKFALKIDALAREAALATGQEVLLFGVQEVVEAILSRIIVAVATDLGISSSILGGGTLSSVGTLGASVVVAIILDQIVSALLKEFGHDPVEAVASAVTKSINDLQWSLISSLQSEMQKLHEARSKLRRETINTMMKEGDE